MKLNPNFDLVENQITFYNNMSVVDGIMMMVGAVLLLINVGIVVRIIYYAISSMSRGDDNGQIRQQIYNHIKAAIIVNVVATAPFVAIILRYISVGSPL